MVESLSLMREAWVRSSAAPTKALEQVLNLHLLLGPYLDGAPACLNCIHFLYNMVLCRGVPLCSPFDQLSIKFIIPAPIIPYHLMHYIISVCCHFDPASRVELTPEPPPIRLRYYYCHLTPMNHRWLICPLLL